MADHKRRFESVADAVALQVGARQITKEKDNAI